jgi:hypothetical protein
VMSSDISVQTQLARQPTVFVRDTQFNHFLHACNVNRSLVIHHVRLRSIFTC